MPIFNYFIFYYRTIRHKNARYIYKRFYIQIIWTLTTFNAKYLNEQKRGQARLYKPLLFMCQLSVKSLGSVLSQQSVLILNKHVPFFKSIWPYSICFLQNSINTYKIKAYYNKNWGIFQNPDVIYKVLLKCNIMDTSVATSSFSSS